MSDVPPPSDLDDLPHSIDDKMHVLITQEYSDLATSLRSNEELGERRLDAYLTLTAAITAAIGLASNRFEGNADPLIAVATVAALLMLLFGFMTLRRIVERNVTTSTFKNGLRRIRAVLVQSQPEVASILAFPPEKEPVIRTKPGARFGIGAGGLLETVAALNAALAGVASGGAVWLGTAHLPLSLFAAAAVFIVAWIVQLTWAGRLYRRLSEKYAGNRSRDLDAWLLWARSRSTMEAEGRDG